MDNSHLFSFERLDAWKLSRSLVREIYNVVKKFPRDELFGMISQARRAAVSVAANIAEGSYRSSRKERLHFYEISFGSLVEVLNLIILANDFGYIKEQEYKTLRNKIQTLSIVLTALSKPLKQPLPP